MSHEEEIPDYDSDDQNDNHHNKPIKQECVYININT